MQKLKYKKTIVLHIVLHGCKVWSIMLKKEHKLRVSENRMLRGMFRSKRDEVTGD
jgi:hypothetical protein